MNSSLCDLWPNPLAASCADDVDLAITSVIRGQDHLTNTFKHVLLPVWVAAYIFRGKTWRFLVNGQTGEVQGEAPLSWVKMLEVPPAMSLLASECT